MKILITGTPGVGKTTLSQKISDETGIEHIDITSFVKNNKIHEYYDSQLDTLVFDEDAVIKALNSYVKDKDSFIVDTHSPVVASDIDFDYIFHIVCNNRRIADRLAMRGYSEHKIQNNIECEIFNTIGEELEEYFEMDVLKVNGSDDINEDAEYSMEEVINLIKKDLRKQF